MISIQFRLRYLFLYYADIMAVTILLFLSALYAWLTWARSPLADDHGWYLQVAARVAAGEVLYRDVCWIYGPLPVYVLGLLYRLLRVDVIMLPLLGQILATLACLMMYWIARFLLSAPLALLSTIAVFMGGRWGGGGLSYILSYPGAIPLGAVLGLLFVVCLLSYLKSRKIFWLVPAGVATGGACLTKPEFALACAGTGMLFLAWIVLGPAGFESCRRRGLRALGIYVASAVIVVGIGYGTLILQAGWPQIWAGVSGYGQAAFLFGFYSPWGTIQSWCYIISGLGVHLLMAVILMSIMAPATVKKHIPSLCALVVLSLALLLLPWVLLHFLMPELLSFMTSSKLMLIQEGIRVIWAPGTLLSTVLIIVLGIRWFKVYLQKQTIGPVEWFYAVLALYSTLVAARFYFNPTSTLLTQYVNTLFPVFVYSLVILVPQAMERWKQIRLQRSRAPVFLMVILLAYAVAGFTLDVKELSRLTLEVATPRGTVLVPPENRPQAETLQYIISHTEARDSIVVLGANPEFYFLSGRRNPLRQDFFRSIMSFSSADAHEVIQRIQTSRPRLVIISIQNRHLMSLPSEDTDILLAQAPDVVREHHENLMSVWEYVQDRYRIRTVVGGEQGGYAIYEPLDISP